MSSRDQILTAIKKNKPALVDLPLIETGAVIQYADLAAQFKTVLESIGGKVITLNDVGELHSIIAAEKDAGLFIVDTITGDIAADTMLAKASSHELALVGRAYIKGTLAVAENGAIWLYEGQLVNRVLPFICEHLVLVIEKENIVATMHHAYAAIDTAREGFGVFIAGPSKTADIEQSLVIGAHGARSLVVYVI